MADGRANEEKNEKDKTEETYTSQDRSEYFGKLEKWLQEAYAWQSVAAMFPYHLLAGQILNRPNGNLLFIYSSRVESRAIRCRR